MQQPEEKEILPTTFKFRCSPVDREAFREIFERQSTLTADLCNELFYNTWRAWRDQGFPRKWRVILQEEVKKARQKYGALLPSAVIDSCVNRVSMQFANGEKRSKLMQRLELPAYSAKSIPIRSDRGMRFERISRQGANLAVRVKLVLLPGHQRQPEVLLVLKDKNAVATMERILRGYELRGQARGNKQCFTSADSWPPSSGGEVIYDRDSKEFFLSIGYSRPALRAEHPDPQRIMAIDAGIASPLTIAFNFEKQPIRLDDFGQMIIESRTHFFKRRRIEQARFAAAPRRVLRKRMEKLSDKWQGELRKIMGNICARIRKIVQDERIGKVFIDRPSSKEPTFFTVKVRGQKFKVPIASLLDMLELDLQELLGKDNVRSQPFYWSSQICSQCGAWNREFTWKYRQDNNWPEFECPQCHAVIDSDINAARTILRSDYDAIVQRIREQYQEEEDVID
jgi:hypothetical protein